MSRLEDARIGDGLLRARWGDVLVKANLAGSFRGCYEATLDGTRCLFRAGYATSKISLYMSSNDGATWTNITPSTGVFGDTRFSGDVTAPIRFAVVRDRGYAPTDAEHDLLLIQNGSSSPLLYGAHATDSSPYVAGNGIVQIVQPPIPTNTTETTVQPGFGDSFPLYDSAAWTYTSGTGITITTGAATPNARPQITVDSTYISGQTAVVDFGANTLDASGAPQLILLTRSLSDDFWAKITMEIGDGTDWLTIISPSLYGEITVIETDNPAPAIFGVSQTIAVDLDQSATSVDLSAIKKLRFSWDQAVPTIGNDEAGVIYMIAASGETPGAASFAIAYGQTDGRTIGPSQILTHTSPILSGAYGGPTSSYLQFTVPFDVRLNYDYSIATFNPTQAEADDGIDRMHVYRQQSGEAGYYWVSSQRLAHWNGAAWVFDSGVAAGAVTVTVPTADEVLSILQPGADAVCVPTGLAMAMANSRLFVGSGARLWISDADFPFIFRKAVRFFDITTPDPTSGTSMAFDGQTVQVVVPFGSFAGAAEDLSTPIAGATTVHVLTDRNLFQLSGFDSGSLSRPIPRESYGTLSPLSVGRSRGGFSWLDNTGQMCYFGMASGLKRFSVSIVDDITTTIPASRKAWVWGACANDRYYMAYTPVTTPASATNDNILVWYERSQTFESIDNASPAAAGLVPFYSSGYVKLLRFSDTELWEHEQPDNDNDVSLAVTFPEIHKGWDGGVSAGQFSIVSDARPSPDPIVYTCRRYYPATNQYGDGTISLATTQPRIWGTENMRAGGPGGPSVQPSLSGDVPGGTRLYSVRIELNDAQFNPTRSL